MKLTSTSRLEEPELSLFITQTHKSLTAGAGLLAVEVHPGHVGSCGAVPGLLPVRTVLSVLRVVLSLPAALTLTTKIKSVRSIPRIQVCPLLASLGTSLLHPVSGGGRLRVTEMFPGGAFRGVVWIILVRGR